MSRSANQCFAGLQHPLINLSNMPPIPLNPERIAEGLDYLTRIDPDLAFLYTTLGSPPLWERAPGFPTLVHIILEQQVSLASARAAFSRLQEASGSISPETFLNLNNDELKQIGFSRQKAKYCRDIALSIQAGNLDLESLDQLEDELVRATLIKVRGIGPWTADIYLLMVLLRPDSWPSGDLALVSAVQQIKNLPVRPDVKQMELLAEAWHPWRAVAARLLWFHYLRHRNLA